MANAKMLPKAQVPKQRNTKKTHEEYLQELKERGKDIIPLEEYNGANTLILHKSPICGHAWMISPANVLNNKRIVFYCKECSKHRDREWRRRSTDDYIAELQELGIRITPVEDYVTATTPIKHRFEDCGHITSVKPADVLNKQKGKDIYTCRACSFVAMGKRYRKGEEYLQKIKDLNIPVEVLEDYVNMRTPIMHRFVECGHEAKLRPDHVLEIANKETSGCNICEEKLKNERKRKTIEEFTVELMEHCVNVDVIEFTGMGNPVKVRCGVCHYEWETFPNSLLKCKTESGCPKCSHLVITNKDFQKRANETKHENVIVLGKYKKANEKIKCMCKQCGRQWHATATQIYGGYGCAECSAKERGIRQRVSYDEVVDRIHLNHPNIEIVGKYEKASKKVMMKCNVCNYEWEGTPTSMFYFDSGCPKCYTPSKGEEVVNLFLQMNMIEFIPQKTFSDLRGVNNGMLSYDFYLPTFNKLIEFQGEQHIRAVSRFGGEEQLKIQQEHDRRKREYAKEHNIDLLEIWYYDIDNIEQILKENLNLESVETVIPA